MYPAPIFPQEDLRLRPFHPPPQKKKDEHILKEIVKEKKLPAHPSP